MSALKQVKYQPMLEVKQTGNCIQLVCKTEIIIIQIYLFTYANLIITLYTKNAKVCFKLISVKTPKH